MGIKGINKKSYACFEELPMLRVTPDAEIPYIYKKLDSDLLKEIEYRKYYIRVLVPKQGGVRKCLKVIDRETAIQRAEEIVIDIKVAMRSGGTVVKFPVQELADRFCKFKKSLVRGSWEGKDKKGKRSITIERYILIESKIRNYVVKFLGANTDVKDVSLMTIIFFLYQLVVFIQMAFYKKLQFHYRLFLILFLLLLSLIRSYVFPLNFLNV